MCIQSWARGSIYAGDSPFLTGLQGSHHFPSELEANERGYQSVSEKRQDRLTNARHLRP